MPSCLRISWPIFHFSLRRENCLSSLSWLLQEISYTNWHFHLLAPLPVPLRIQKAHISSYERNTFSLPELVSLMKPPLSHLVENSEDVRAQYQSHSVKLQQLSLREEGLGWEVGGETTGSGPEEGGRELGVPCVLTHCCELAWGLHSNSSPLPFPWKHAPCLLFVWSSWKGYFFALSQCLAFEKAPSGESSVAIPLNFSSVW